MAKTIYYAAASLDGYIAAPGDDLDWLTKYEGSADLADAEPDPMSEGGGYDAFYADVNALVMGSVTYEWVLAHLRESGAGWPYAGKPSWVLTSRDLAPPEGAGADDVRFANAPVRELVPELQAAAAEGTLWIVGGGGIASDFADEGLLDELHVTVVPVILGAGKPLFERPVPSPMKLLGVSPSKSGMTELRYAL